jgi:hypothetical protein
MPLLLLLYVSMACYMVHFMFNLLKPAGHVMHQQFNIQQLYAHPHCIYVFCIYLRTNSDLCHLQNKLIGLYNRDEKCLQRGTDWVFKYRSQHFVFCLLLTSGTGAKAPVALQPLGLLYALFSRSSHCRRKMSPRPTRRERSNRREGEI